MSDKPKDETKETDEREPSRLDPLGICEGLLFGDMSLGQALGRVAADRGVRIRKPRRR